MIACYDLARCPPTYDVVAFLAHAELERRRQGDERIDLHVLPGPVGGFRRDDLWPHSIEARVAMRCDVLLPICSLLPAVWSVTTDRDRAISGWGKDQYLVGLPRIVDALKADCRPLCTPRVAARSGVSFTLREAEHWPLRNSRTEEWIAAAKILTARGIEVTVVRDTARAAEPIEGVKTFEPASRSVGARASLYHHSLLNVGIGNGPMWMAIFMDEPTLMLRPTTNAAGGCYDDAFYAHCGIRRGDQLPCSPSHQRLAWEEDTRENIVRGVEEMLEVVCRQ